MKRFFDTSSILICNDLTSDDIISSITLQELENIKTSAHKDDDIKMKARHAVRMIENSGCQVIIFDNVANIYNETDFTNYSNDEKIIVTAMCYHNHLNTNEPLIVYSEDLLFRLIAYNIYNLNVSSIQTNNNQNEVYNGYIVIENDDDRLEEFYTNPNNNIFNCVINQYIMIKDIDGNVADYWKWTSDKYVKVTYKSNRSDWEKIKPRSPEQYVALNLLNDDSVGVKLLSGKFGSGKSMLSILSAMNMIKAGRYDKLVFIRNHQKVKDSEEIGFLPGSADEKLMEYSGMLADHLGGSVMLEDMVKKEEIELCSLSMIRGRDFRNSIIYVTETQQFNIDHIRLLLGRVGEGSIVIFEGDIRQVDKDSFKGDKNGINALLNGLKGNPLFGYVYLPKVERSSIAALSEII